MKLNIFSEHTCTFRNDIRFGILAPAADASAAFRAQQASDVAFLDNKVDVGLYFSAILGMSNLEDAQAVMALYDGSTSSVMRAKDAADLTYVETSAADGSGALLIQLVGVVDDPFA